MVNIMYGAIRHSNMNEIYSNANSNVLVNRKRNMQWHIIKRHMQISIFIKDIRGVHIRFLNAMKISKRSIIFIGDIGIKENGGL